MKVRTKEEEYLADEEAGWEGGGPRATGHL